MSAIPAGWLSKCELWFKGASMFIKSFLGLVLFFSTLLGWDECCRDDEEDLNSEECDCEFTPDIDRSYLRDEADWPTKNEDPFVESLKN